MSTRKQHSAKFKAKVALEALKGLKTISQLAHQYEVHPTQISHWKRQLLEGAETLFASAPHRADQQAEALQAQLYEEIGRLKIENDFLKKKLPSSRKALFPFAQKLLNSPCKVHLGVESTVAPMGVQPQRRRANVSIWAVTDLATPATI